MLCRMSDEELRKAARKNLKARNDFKVMLSIFIVVALILVAVWFFSTGGTGYFWPVWPIFGLTIAAVFAGLDAYGVTRRHITEADVDAEIARMSRRAGGTDAGGPPQA
jgi:uncharacterized membrane protein